MLYQARYAAYNWRGRDDDMMHHSDLCNKTDRFTLNGYGIFDTDTRNNRRSHPKRMDETKRQTIKSRRL